MGKDEDVLILCDQKVFANRLAGKRKNIAGKLLRNLGYMEKLIKVQEAVGPDQWRRY